MQHNTAVTNWVARRRPAFMLVAVLFAAAACSHGSAPTAHPTVTASQTPNLPEGTPDWEIHNAGAEHAIEGFTDHISALPGDQVRMYVSTTAQTYQVRAFRMGHYSNSEAKQVWISAKLPGKHQPAPIIQAPTNTAVAPWESTLTVDTKGWQPGDYLLRLEADSGAMQYVPLTVRTPSNKGKIVIINAVTTWQAYNAWGGYSLYHGPSGGLADRAHAVSFDRPYQAKSMNGAGDFLFFELPFLLFAERSGHDLGYATDVDLEADPHVLDGAAAVITLSHDEYWSPKMRNAFVRARDKGTNLAFLGGNDAYRHIRFDKTPLGPNRLEIDYKSFDEDPISATHPDLATQEWRYPPNSKPESAILGNYYHCNPVTADLVAVNTTNWLTKGLVTAGQHLPRMVGDEYNTVDLSVPTPRPLEVLFHSPLTCRGKSDFADVTYYTTASGAGVFAAGTEYWVCGIDPWCKRANSPDDITRRTMQAMTTRLLDGYAKGPVGRTHPAEDNLVQVGVSGAADYPNPNTPNALVPQ